MVSTIPSSQIFLIFFMNSLTTTSRRKTQRKREKNCSAKHSSDTVGEQVFSTASTVICFDASAEERCSIYILTTHWKEKQMTETTGNTVLMKCEYCGYEEYLPLSDLLLLRELQPFDPEDHVLCPFCLHDMYRKDSHHFTNQDK